ncbi:MAG: zf-TFIIB domain-containing protein [Vicinamibacterales bacterium]|nr:zf-TFIIB domain-containing protein [Vicinamibacterales bacterium]
MRIDRDHSTLVCDHCGNQQELPWIAEHVDLLGETTSPCPVCGTPLSDSRLEGFPVLCCSRCFGMLIGMNRFAALIDAVRVLEERSFRTLPPRRQNPNDRVVNCPKCRAAMLSHLYGGPGNIVIDSCEQCQVNWLDSGELRRTAIAPDGPRGAS